MDKEAKGVVQHALTFVGGLLIMYGYMDNDLPTANVLVANADYIVGAISTLIGTGWAIYDLNNDAFTKV